MCEWVCEQVSVTRVVCVCVCERERERERERVNCPLDKFDLRLELTLTNGVALFNNKTLFPD